MERVLELIGLLASGEIVVPEIQRFAHEDAAHAHKALEGRSTVGGSVLSI
jgi:hypothetical protein